MRLGFAQAEDVISPSDKEHQLRRKIGNYLAAGTLLWVVYPAAQEVEVYAPGQPVQVIGRDGVLDGAPVLPGFALDDMYDVGATKAVAAEVLLEVRRL